LTSQCVLVFIGSRLRGGHDLNNHCFITLTTITLFNYTITTLILTYVHISGELITGLQWCQEWSNSRRNNFIEVLFAVSLCFRCPGRIRGSAERSGR
jgi:hypothetical protein